MKRSLIILFLLAITSALTAQKTIWTMDWAKVKAEGPTEGVYDAAGSDPLGVLYNTDQTANTPEEQTAGADVWSTVGRIIGPNIGQTGKGGIWVEQKASGVPAPSRGISYVLDSSFFTPGAGEYTFNYEIWSVYKPTTLNVVLYEAQAAPENDYFIPLGAAGGTALWVTPVEGSSATVSLLGLANHNRADAGGDIPFGDNMQWSPRSMTFNYSGTGDVVIHFYGLVAGETGWCGFTIGGDMTIVDPDGIPDPDPDPLWAGFPIRPDGYVDTTPFLGWIWVGDPGAPSDWIWSVNLGGYVYLPQGQVAPETGAWAFLPSYSVPGDTTEPLWAGYSIRPDGYVDTGSFVGWIWVGEPGAPSDWVWSVSLSSYVYMPQVVVNPGVGAWAYLPW
ncbi:MAG: hypothetical protein AB3N33_06795 [Puniceicoccaceae bacterium]